MKIKRFIGLICSFILSFLLSFSAFAGEFHQLPPNKSINNFSFEIDLLEEFNIAEYEEYFQTFKDYNIDIDNIIAVIPDSEISGDLNDSRSISSPGGVIVVSGQFLSSHTWRLIVTNAGILKVNDMEADVILLDANFSVALCTQSRIGKLGLFGTISENFTASGMYDSVQSAIVTVTGTTSNNEWFNIGGAQVRQ